MRVTQGDMAVTSISTSPAENQPLASLKYKK